MREMYMKFFAWRKACELELRDRYVYAYASYRGRVGEGVLLAELKDALPFSNGISVSLQTLQKLGLTTRTEIGWLANEPPAALWDWFVLSAEEPKDWTDKYMGFRMGLPTRENPLTANGQVLYWLVKDLIRQEKPITTSGLATILKTTRQTILNNLKTLRQWGLINMGETIETLDLVGEYDLPTQWEIWWKQRKKKQESPYQIYYDGYLKGGISRYQLRQLKSVVRALEEYFPERQPKGQNWESRLYMYILPSVRDILRDSIDYANQRNGNHQFENTLRWMWKKYYIRKKQVEQGDTNILYTYDYDMMTVEEKAECDAKRKRLADSRAEMDKLTKRFVGENGSAGIGLGV